MVAILWLQVQLLRVHMKHKKSRARAQSDIGHHDNGGDPDFFGMTMLGGMSCKGGNRPAAVLREF